MDKDIMINIIGITFYLNNKMRISIIVPVYNVESYITRCFNSIKEQDYTNNLECIFIDDCGTDNSIEILKKLIENYEGNIEFRILSHNINRGLSAARNTGIANSKGNYLYFLDSDDEITSNCISSFIAILNKYPNVDLIQGNIVPNDNTKWLYFTQDTFPEYSDDKSWITINFLDNVPVTSWNKLIKKDFILKNKLYFKEGIIHEDFHWKLFSYNKINSIAFNYNETYNYELRKESIVTSKFKDKSYQSFTTIIMEYLTSEHVIITYSLCKAIFYDWLLVNKNEYKILKEPNIYLQLRNKMLKQIRESKKVRCGVKVLAKYILNKKEIKKTVIIKALKLIYIDSLIKNKLL